MTLSMSIVCYYVYVEMTETVIKVNVTSVQYVHILSMLDCKACIYTTTLYSSKFVVLRSLLITGGKKCGLMD